MFWKIKEDLVFVCMFFLQVSQELRSFKEIALRKIFLTLSWRRPLSYRNQSIDLLRKKSAKNYTVIF